MGAAGEVTEIKVCANIGEPATVSSRMAARRPSPHRRRAEKEAISPLSSKRLRCKFGTIQSVCEKVGYSGAPTLDEGEVGEDRIKLGVAGK